MAVAKKPTWLKRFLGLFKKRPTLGQLYSGKCVADCEHCDRTILLQMNDGGEILNVRFLGMNYICRECADAIFMWEEGERIWVGRKDR